MIQDQAVLVGRLRTLLADEASTREISMFGGRAFMVNDTMVVSALRSGDLLVHVASSRDSDLIEVPGASRAEMGAGRDMGPGWITVSVDAIMTDDSLSFWIEVALDHNRSAVRGPA